MSRTVAWRHVRWRWNAEDEEDDGGDDDDVDDDEDDDKWLTLMLVLLAVSLFMVEGVDAEHDHN